MRRLALVLVAVTASSAVAKPKPKVQQPSAADNKKVKTLLNKGRELEDKKKYADAIAAFEEALKISPDDAVLLSELGFTAYLNKDYKKADEATRKSLGLQATPSVRGATLFNLGLILEEKGDKAGAIAAYLDSLRIRPNNTVLGRLKKLDSKAADSLDAYRPIPLQAWDSTDAYCKAQKPHPTFGEELKCSCGAEKASSSSLAAPFDDAKFFSLTCAEPVKGQFGYTEDNVAVKVGGKWFVSKMGERDFNRHCEVEAKYGAIKVTGGHLVADYAEEGECAGGGRTLDWTMTRNAVLGVGSSKTPSATKAIVVSHHEDEIDDTDDKQKASTPTDIQLELVWNNDGSLEVKANKTKGLDATEQKQLVGKHALAFP